MNMRSFHFMSNLVLFMPAATFETLQYLAVSCSGRRGWCCCLPGLASVFEACGCCRRCRADAQIANTMPSIPGPRPAGSEAIRGGRARPGLCATCRPAQPRGRDPDSVFGDEPRRGGRQERAHRLALRRRARRSADLQIAAGARCWRRHTKQGPPHAADVGSQKRARRGMRRAGEEEGPVFRSYRVANVTSMRQSTSTIISS